MEQFILHFGRARNDVCPRGSSQHLITPFLIHTVKMSRAGLGKRISSDDFSKRLWLLARANTININRYECVLEGSLLHLVDNKTVTGACESNSCSALLDTGTSLIAINSVFCMFVVFEPTVC